MKIPPNYPQWLESLGFSEVCFGYTGLKLFSLDELEGSQIGYSISAEGNSFCDGLPGAWKSEWIAIGRDTLCGDPIILNTARPELPVMTAIHGEGSWDPSPIAS